MYFKLETTAPVGALVEAKHVEYVQKARRYALFYYATRLVAGLSAGLLPFTVGRIEWQAVSVSLSLVIVIITVLDLVFTPKDRWVLFSKATDLLTVAKVKALGDAEYAKHKDALDTLLNTESANLAQVINLSDLVTHLCHPSRQFIVISMCYD